ncbi:MAG: hypothetical protein P4L43_16985 [Syntrophobacteraceae bacterium]|nr:hypothetical protein [Syntrophobacteraceae bacterium]
MGARYRANTSQVPKEEERGGILCFDQWLSYKSELQPPFPLRDIHQILVHDGKLWVTCPFDNMIGVYDGASREAWRPLGIPSGERRDVNHFNSLTGWGNKLCIVAHNWSGVTGKPSELHFFGLPDRGRRRSIAPGNQAHNAWLHEGEIMTCSSGEGRLVGLGGKSIQTGGFPRGIAYLDGEICVGISEFAERPDRDLGNGWFQIFDSQWKLPRTIKMTGEGMVTDMMAITPIEAEQIIYRRDFGQLRFDVEPA